MKSQDAGLGSGALREALERSGRAKRDAVSLRDSLSVEAAGYKPGSGQEQMLGWAQKADEVVMSLNVVCAALSLSSPIEPPPQPASERHPNPGRDKLAGEAIRELGAIEAGKPKALKWLIKWDQAKKLHPSQDVCVADLAALLVRGSQASSEVREALTKVKAIVMVHREGDKADYHAIIHELDALERMSRGAGGSTKS